MSLLSVAFAVVAAFVMLSLVASDRQRRLNDEESLRLAKEHQAQIDAQPPETH